MKTSNSKAARLVRLHETLSRLGFTYEEAETLRRAEMTLSRWAERLCNGEIERDEKSGLTFHAWNNGTRRQLTRCPDRETGALKRIEAVVKARNAREPESGPLSFYHQTDPRGAALYILRPGDVPEGKDVGSYYSRGLAVCI